MVDLQTAKSRLETQLAELTQRLANLASDLDETPDPDSAEHAVQKEDDASLEAQAMLVRSEIASTNRALDRIAEGTWGDCVECGAAIAPGRLEARPEAALCISCASRS